MKNTRKNITKILIVAAIVALLTTIATISRAEEYPIYVNKKVNVQRLQKAIKKRTGFAPKIVVVRSFTPPNPRKLNFRISPVVKYPEFLSIGSTNGRASGPERFIVDAYAYAVGCNKPAEDSDRVCRETARYYMFAMQYRLQDLQSMGVRDLPGTCEHLPRDRQNYVTEQCCYYYYNDGRCELLPNRCKEAGGAWYDC